MHDRPDAGGASAATASTAQPAAGTRVSIRNVRRQFPNGVLALDDITFDVPPGQFIAILGPSGSGKSTLLRLVAGLDRPQGGSVTKGEPVAGPPSSFGLRPSSLAYVFQDAHLLPWRTVLRNVALPLELQNVPKRQRLARARAAIDQVGLTDAADRYPAQLSGGMRMRASLARALVTDPSLFLLDEPFAALDEITRHRLDEELLALWRRRRMTVVFVTHSINEAVFLAQRAVVLSRRPARILLDRRINLPEERTEELRTTAAFAAEAHALHVALRGEEA
jgi:NitT/TauT family transport system ATP-binding protein